MTNPRRAALAAMLLAARQRTGLSGNQFSKRLGWPQSKVSRLETGSQLPTRTDVEAWSDAADAGAVVYVDLLNVLDLATTRELRVRDAAQRAGGVSALQGELEELERGSTRIVEYQPLLIPGLAQIAQYTREWLTQPGRPTVVPDLNVEAAIVARARRQSMLDESTRTITLAINEAALWAVYGAQETQQDQLHHLADLAATQRIELLIEPRQETLATMSGFELLDDVVCLEGVEGMRILGDAEVVAGFAATLEALRARCISGGSAVVYAKDLALSFGSAQ